VSLLESSSSGNNVQGKIPSHPVGCCLEALLSFFLQCDKDEGGADGEAWTTFLCNAMINVVMSAAAVVNGALAVDSTLFDWYQSLVMHFIHCYCPIYIHM
jgi:hypothetical protein